MGFGNTFGDMFSAMLGGGKFKNLARTEEERRQQQIQQGLAETNKTFSLFNPKFYQQRQQAYTNYAMPQLGEQARQQQKQMSFGMFDRGVENSGIAQSAQSKLNKEIDLQKQGIIDTGYQQAQDLRKQVETQRSNVIGQLQASGDPRLAAQQALQTASTYSMPSTFAPLTNLFSNFASLYGKQQVANAYNPNQYVARYGLTSPLSNSASVVKKN